MLRNLIFALSICTAATLMAEDNNERLDIGSKAPEWKDLPGTDGKRHSLKDLKDKDVVVVVFTCNSCPYANDVEKRLNAFAKKHSKGKVALVAINVNKVKEDQMPAMKKRAKEKGYKYPYLYDESQKVARDFGAIFTPEFFVLNKKREVVYMGAFDDSPTGKEVKKHFVDDAVASAGKGEKAKVETSNAIGCLIRFDRRSRRRRRK